MFYLSFSHPALGGLDWAWAGLESLKPNLSEMTLCKLQSSLISPRPGWAIENILIFDYLQATCNQALKTPEMSLKPKYGGMSLSARTYCQEKSPLQHLPVRCQDWPGQQTIILIIF